MKFLIDAQLPPALARFLQSKGHDAVHADSVGLLSAEDSEIWDFAVANGYIIFTKDEDFSDLMLLKKNGPAVVGCEWAIVRTVHF